MMAAEFGATAWGRAWLRTIESTAATAPDAQLPQARRLARGGAVTLTDVAAGRVRAEVVVRQAAHALVIEVPLWDDAALATAWGLLNAAGRVGGAASGDLPDGVVAELQKVSVAVAAPPEECSAACTCSSRRSPCLHHLATVYALVQLIDEEPALAVRLRSDDSLAAGSADSDARPVPGWVPLSEVDPATFYG